MTLSTFFILFYVVPLIFGLIGCGIVWYLLRREEFSGSFGAVMVLCFVPILNIPIATAITTAIIDKIFQKP